MKKFIKYYSLFILLISFFIISCSSSENKKILGFFFDGVEVSNLDDEKDQKTIEKQIEKNESAGSIVTIFYHQVYKEKLCDNCHDPEIGNGLVEPEPDLCYMCHTNFADEFENIHYPVFDGECGVCHKPHQSEFPKLLTMEVRELCLTCHDDPVTPENEIHFSLGKINCLECHNPHGSNNESLL